MKKLTLSLMAAFVMLLFVPTQLQAATDPSPVTVAATNTVKSVDVSVLIARVETIKAMDRSTLSASEKKELRKELRTIKNDLKASSKNDANANSATVSNGGIYLSVGAIIIIILLLILLL
ncbi:MAG: hypothetical protein NTY07_01890 [Bacteroidia bacterium]|nr:hypothetical protein [Bacteroidia bacterium]